MNRRERFLKGRQVAARRARKLGHIGKFKDLPISTKKYFISPNNIRISQRSDRKCFDRSYYGHFLNGTKKDLQERAEIRELDKEIEDEIQNF